MRHELESLPDRINRLERQLRLFEIAAAVLAVLAIAFALAPRPSAMVLGLDARPGTGNDANRERINLVADEKGGAHIRFLDRRTSVVSRMYLDEQNRAWLSFSDFSQTPPVIRRYGLVGEELLRPQAR
jgi:hypothetical protein